MDENISELTFNDGTVVKIDAKLNLKKLMMIDKDFDTSEFAKLTMGNKSAEISVMQAAKAVYVAYRQANMSDYINFYEFIDRWDIDMEFGSLIYSLMMFKSARDAYQKEFERQAKLIMVKNGKK
ncbi:hypothetical protein [Enterococcus nangangensis]|uniref:hypothetical protein n=1 Tax=Enterococcus nangangensis TaxID=2559926 RepID=UPI0010F4BF49|nr:hypothetical protein [Enterococcus nangangensis]